MILLFDTLGKTRDAIKKNAELNNIYVVKSAITYGKEDYIFRSDGHPGARIHSLYAQELYDFFEAHKKEISARSHPKDLAVGPPKIDPVPNSHYKNGFLKSYYYDKIVQKF